MVTQRSVTEKFRFFHAVFSSRMNAISYNISYFLDSSFSSFVMFCKFKGEPGIVRYACYSTKEVEAGG